MSGELMTTRFGLRAHDDALSAVAHELRLPLSHIKGFITSLRRADVNWDEETRREFLAEIDLETDRLGQLVESLLPGATPCGSLAPGADLAFTDPASVVDGALHRTRGLLGERSVRRKIPPHLPAVLMDASQMERVLANLLQNTIKYSPAATPVGVSTRITRDGELELAVEDEGPGIPAEDRDRIFEPFFRKEAAKQSDVPGNGLGLAICQSIVLAHGGRIRVTNRRGGGARFSVFLPGPIRTQQFEKSSVAKDGTEALKLIEEHPFDRRRRSVANTKGVGRGGGRGRRGRVGRNLT